MKNLIRYSFNELIFVLFVTFCLLYSLFVHAEDITPESMIGKGACTAAGHDAACWQAAINASPHWPVFGTVAGSSGKQYLINETIVVCNASEGLIDGHGSQLYWTGSSGKPMFLVIGSNHIRFANLKVQSDPSKPLDAAFEFTSTRNTQSNPYPAPVCPGSSLPSSKNSIEHVGVEGTDLNGLNYGVRFSNRYDYDANNDMSTIVDSTFYNITVATVSIEHSQSHQHRLISVNGYGAQGNLNGCFVNAPYGFFSSVGGFQSNWGRANFCVGGTSGTFDITESNSEGSNRLLLAGNSGDYTSFPVSVNIQGGRFAVNGLNPDGKVIDFNRLGPLTIRGFHIDGIPPSGVQPSISVQPSQGNSSPVLASSVIVEGYLILRQDQIIQIH